jgi:protein phosphatase
MSGKNNEDRYAVSAYYLKPDQTRQAVLAVVADGIGGHRAGEVAAELAVDTISKVVAESDGREPAQTLQEAIISASQAVLERSESDATLRGMGTTCACAWVIEDRLYTATVGDSRIYLVRGESIRQLTTDHTWVQEAVESGLISPEQARSHPNAHVIRRYLGSRQQVVPDLRLYLRKAETDAHAEANQGVRLQPGDILLLCSDGLTDLVESGEILASIQARGSEKSLDELVGLANERGGHDNITIITLRVPEPARAAVPVPQATPEPLPTRRLSFGLSCAVFGGLLLAGLAVLAGLYWYAGRPAGETNLTPSPPSANTSPAVVIPSSPTPRQGGSPSASPSAFSPLHATVTFTLRPGAFPGSGPTLTPWPTNTLASP